MYFLQMPVWLLSQQKHAEEMTKLRDKLEKQLTGKLETHSADSIPLPRPNSLRMFN